MIELENCNRFLPVKGQKYYTPSLSVPLEINQYTWNDTTSDHIAFNQGLVFSSRSQARHFHDDFRKLIIKFNNTL